jgi:uncharacterized membrane protein
VEDIVVFFGFLIALIFIFGPYLFTLARTSALRRTLEELRAENRDIDKLTARVWELERTVATLKSELARRTITPAAELAPVAEPVPAPIHETAAEPAPPKPALPPVPETIAGTEPLPTPEIVAPPEPQPVAPIIPEAVPVFAAAPVQEPTPGWRDRISTSMAGQEWESTLGGNFLNKLGVLVLIIGIALFLGYSFTKMGPAGRVATAIAVSGAMLAAGVVLERKAQYRVFARGLLGGGWAGIYFTAYAMYAVDAAKVIDSPWVASVVLTAVAAGMIAHSLKYRSQALTGVAYFVAFASLALTPVTSFSVVALLPLAASMLYLANRFQWFSMAPFGVLATYGTCASRGDSGASVAAAQSIVGAYWLLFEIFVILRARASRERAFSLAEQWIFPLNTLGLFALSLPKWQHAASQHVWAFLAACAAAHVIGSILRGRSSQPTLVKRMASGGYEGPIALSTIFAAVAIFLKLTNVWINVAWLMEAQVLFLAGLWLREIWLERLGAAVFGLATLKLAAEDAPQGQPHDWTPVALLSAALMYANRYLRRTAKYFSYGAAIPILLVAGYNSPQAWVAVAWFGIAVALFEFGLFQDLIEFRIQCYAFTAFATGAVFFNSLEHTKHWPAIGSCVLLAYWLAIRAGKLTGLEAEWVPMAMSWCTTAVAVLFAGVAAPPEFRGAAWIAVAAIMVELGHRGLPRHFLRQSYPVALLGWGHVLFFGVLHAGKTMPRDGRLSLAAAALLSYAIAARVFSRDRFHRIAGSLAGSVFASALIWIVVPDPAVAVGWATLSFLLLQFNGANTRVLTIQADLLAAAAFGRLFFANFVNMGSTGGISHRLLTVAPIVVGEYYAWWRRRGEVVSRIYLYAAPILIVLLMRFEFGRVLTVAGWAALALALYWFGRRRADLDMRLQSYAVALLCFWRSWTTNFYIPDSFAGVPGRIATAAFVVLALYAAQFLAPRESRGPGLWIDRHARTVFSLLASALIAILLYYEVRGGGITVAWGVQAVCLMAVGFGARDRILRLSGLLIFLVCILKLFLYDLRYLDTISRIFSFIVLGAVMVAVSWVYTRFRNQIQRYL